MKPRLDLKHERVTVLEIADSRFNILCINAYFPYLDTSKINEQLNLYRDVVGFVEQ